MVKNKFIGSGITFPIQLNADGRPDFVNDMSLIISSIKTILYWPIYTRFFNENFGCRLEELIDEPHDGIAKSLLRTFIEESLYRYEKRINVNSVKVTSHDLYTVYVEIKITLRNSKIEETFIFPYYKNL
jgi:phage baseplate assembly protein W